MRLTALVTPTFALVLSVSLIGTASAQTGGGAQQNNTGDAGAAGATLGGGGGGVGAGTPGQNLNLTTLGLAEAFGANDVFADSRRATGQSAGAGGNNTAGRGGLRSTGNIFSQLFGGGNQPQASRRTLRAPLRVDFDVIRPDNTSVATQLEKRFVHIKPLKGVGNNIQVQVIDRVATLTGTVNTATEKDMAERITRLEPGISSVRNELTVRPKTN